MTAEVELPVAEAPRVVRTPGVNVPKAKRDILAGLRAEFGDAEPDPVLLENAARTLARSRQVATLVDRLPPESALMAKTVRGITVHPYVGHERDLRTQLRLDLIALRASLGGRGGVGGRAPSTPTGGGRPDSLTDALGPPARRLEAI